MIEGAAGKRDDRAVQQKRPEIRSRTNVDVVGQGRIAWPDAMGGNNRLRGSKRIESHGDDRKIDDKNDRQTEKKQKPFTVQFHDQNSGLSVFCLLAHHDRGECHQEN
jgi:hypothetical protein